MQTYFKVDPPQRGYAILIQTSASVFTIQHITLTTPIRKLLLHQICKQADNNKISLVAHNPYKIADGFGFEAKFDTFIRTPKSDNDYIPAFCEMLREDSSGNYITVKYSGSKATHFATVNQYGERLNIYEFDSGPENFLRLPYL